MKKILGKKLTFKTNGIKSQFFIPTIIMLLIIIISVSILFNGQYSRRFQNSNQQAMEYISNDVNMWLDSVVFVVSVISDSVRHIDDSAKIFEMFKDVESTDNSIKNVYFVSTVPYKDGGEMIITFEIPSDFDQTTRPWYKNAIKNPDDVVMTEPYVDIVSGNIVVTVAKAVLEDNGTLLGVVGADIVLTEINTILERYKNSGNTMDLMIAYSDGQYMTHKNINYIMNKDYNVFDTIKDDSIKQKMLGRDYFFEYSNEYFYSSKKLKTGWYVLDFGKNDIVIGQLKRLFIILVFATSFIFICQYLLVTLVVVPLTKVLKQAGDNMKEMSNGNFAIKLDEKSKRRRDEVGLLASSTDDMKNSLSGILYEIQINSQSINSLMQRMHQGNENLASRTENQSSSLEEVASSIEEMSAAIKQTSDNAKTAEEDSIKVKAVAHSGVQIVKETIINMQDIYEASKKISDITTVIENIAFQTNILALNAAVEAARAGEQGRGFAVVASEVRNLAINSSNSAKDITNLINDAVSKIEYGREASEKSGVLLEETETIVNKVADFLSDISISIIEQSKGIEQINEAVINLNDITQENVVLVNDSAEVGKNIFEGTNNLLNGVLYFKFEDNDEADK